MVVRSIRLEEDLVKRVEEIAKANHWSLNRCIGLMLRVVLDLVDAGDLAVFTGFQKIERGADKEFVEMVRPERLAVEEKPKGGKVRDKIKKLKEI